MPSKLDGITNIEAFKELHGRVGAKRPEEYVTDKLQPKAGLIGCRMK